MNSNNLKSFITMTIVAILIFALAIFAVERSKMPPKTSDVQENVVAAAKEVEQTRDAEKESDSVKTTVTPAETPVAEPAPEPDDGSGAVYEKGKELFEQALYIEAIDELTKIEEGDRFYAEGTKLLTEVIDTYRSEMHTKADTLVSEGNRKDAIHLLRELIYRLPDSEETSRKLEENTNAYREELLASVDAIYNSGGFDAVLERLTEASVLLGHDMKIEAELDKWRDRKAPTYLVDMEYFSKGESICAESSGSALVDNYENTYSSGIDQTNYRWVLDGVDDIEYYLGGEYSTFAGTVYVTKDARSLGVDKWEGCGIEIYADDVLLAAYTGLGYKSEPIDFELNVKDVEFLRIRFGGCYMGTWSDALIVLGNGRVGW